MLFCRFLLMVVVCDVFDIICVWGRERVGRREITSFEALF